MKKKKVHKLQNFYPEDFHIICIASHQNDYRLSWALNEQLNLRLRKDQDLTVEGKKSDTVKRFTRYSYDFDDRSVRYHLIANKNSQGFLFSDMKNIDFLLKIEGDMDEESVSFLLKGIRNIDFVIIAFRMENLREKHKKMLNF
ncbi:MAG: IPExxxVDY family protein [Bacteroidales bacterium]